MVARKYGMVTFYIRPAFRADFEKFTDLIEKDERLKGLRAKKRDGLISIALMQLILKYNNDNDNSVDNNDNDDSIDNEENNNITETEKQQNANAT